MEGVFSYFVSIGAGLATGVSLVFLPSAWLYNKIKNKGGKDNGTIQRKQQRAV